LARVRLASLQKAITAALLLLAMVFVASGMWWALALIPLAYASILALEFMLMSCINSRHQAPWPGLAALIQAWWGEVCAAPRVFCWWQPFRSERWADQIPEGSSGTRGVLLVHGFFCNRGLWSQWLARLRDAGVPVIAVNLEPVFGSIDDYARTIDSAVSSLTACTGLPPMVVAHSMGGLAVRAWLAQTDPARAHHVITLGTPHRGTFMAHGAFSENCAQMRIGSGWLASLAALEARQDPLKRPDFTCFYSHCDNIVFPADTGTLPGADNRALAATAHVHMCAHPAPFEELQRRLAGLSSC
jgi:triacylglycerol lipase